DRQQHRRRGLPEHPDLQVREDEEDGLALGGDEGQHGHRAADDAAAVARRPARRARRLVQRLELVERRAHQSWMWTRDGAGTRYAAPMARTMKSTSMTSNIWPILSMKRLINRVSK